MKQTLEATQHLFSRAGNDRLSRRLVVASLCASLLVALLVSALQIYFRYQQEVQNAHARLADIETIYVPNIAASVWETNDAATARLLDGLSALPNVGVVTLLDESGRTTQRQGTRGGRQIEKTSFALLHDEGGQQFPLGRLQVELNDASILDELQTRVVGIIITSAVTLLFASLFSALLFQRWVARHLEDTADYVRLAAPDAPPLRLDRPAPAIPDELDHVVNAINRMRASVQQDMVSMRDLLSTAASVASLGIWSWTLASNALQWNERNYAIFDLEPDAPGALLDGARWHSRVHPDDIAIAKRALYAAACNGKPFDIVFRVLTRGGPLRYVQSAARIERDADGRALRVIGICRDISDQHELETRLRAAKDEAELASRAKSEFVANMSHEIRTPLNAVLGVAQVLSQGPLSAQQQASVGMILASGQSLLAILNDILDFSKVEAGRMDLSALTFNLDEVIAPVHALLANQASAKGLVFEIARDPAIPPALVGDPLRLQQILVNLVGNAIKFTPAGSVHLGASVLAQSDEGIVLQLVVRDTGIGMSETQQAALFSPFTQADASITRQFGGTGLGLAISKKLLDLMGGTITISSTPGQGSVFEVRLPLKEGVAAAAPAAAANWSTPPLQGLQLLLVEDNAINQFVARKLLEAAGAAVDLAEDGQQAVDRLRAAPDYYRLVLMDVQMPVMDGLTATRAIRAQLGLQLPIVAMTAGVMESEREQCVQAGMNGFVSKPVDQQQMIDTILAQLATAGG